MSRKKGTSSFMKLLKCFIDTYLVQARGLSQNTVFSYKTAFRLLIDYMYTQKGIFADELSFDTMNFDTLTGFMGWLENERGCSALTRNQQLAAICSFSEFAQNRDFDAASSFRSAVLKIPSKNAAGREKAFFTVDEIRILFSLPDEKRGWNLACLILVSKFQPLFRLPH